MIGQTYKKHWLPGILKSHEKSTNMENSDNGIYLLSAALCSFLSLDDLVRFLCSFNRVNCPFTFHLRYR